MRRSVLLAVIVCFVFSSQAQELLRDISGNPYLKKASEQPVNKSVQQSETVLELPFFDDFSYRGVYPDQNKWVGKSVYRNDGFPVNPPSVGVATLDAMNQYGEIYEIANPYGFSSDTLTSCVVRLDSLLSPEANAISIADSLYLSFYYQPGGLGNSPEEADSLVLEFLAVGENDTTYVAIDPEADPIVYDTIITEGWNYVWSAEGDSLASFHADSGFRQVAIPILDSVKYYNKDFQFRFRNYASVDGNNLESWRGNTDHWNVDYVYLNTQRNQGDTVYRDLVFVDPGKSLLKEYTAMPFWQYGGDFVNAIGSKFDMKISNLYNEDLLGIYNYKVLTPSGGEVFTYDGGDQTIEPFSVTPYVQAEAFAQPPVAGFYPPYSEAIEFKVVHTLSGGETIGQSSNDTVVFYQNFDNYYAYDDASAETGYGFGGAYNEVAIRYQVSERDTLRGVQIYFNMIKNEEDYPRPFRIRIRESINEIPGDSVYYEQFFTSPIVYGQNIFHVYTFNEAVPLKANKIYFVCIEQSTDDFLNLGFDKNNNQQAKTFYTKNDFWEESEFKGCVMVRPVFGSNVSPGPYQIEESALDNLKLYPNPAYTNVIKIELNVENEQDYRLDMFNALGTAVYSGNYKSRIQLGNLTNGIYIVRITNTVSNESTTRKLILAR